MGVARHTIFSPDGADLGLFDRSVMGKVTVTYAAGVSAGAASTIAVTWSEPLVSTGYVAIPEPVEDATYFVSAKTAVGCTLNVNPRLATNTLAGSAITIFLLG